MLIGRHCNEKGEIAKSGRRVLSPVVISMALASGENARTSNRCGEGERKHGRSARDNRESTKGCETRSGASVGIARSNREDREGIRERERRWFDERGNESEDS